MDKHTKNSTTRKAQGQTGKASGRPAARRKTANRLAVGVDLGDRYSIEKNPLGAVPAQPGPDLR